jgi:hypothetical protein
MAKGQRRNLDVKFTFKCSQGNTIVTGVPLGAIGEWVGRLGGDDLCVEELILFGEAFFNGVKFELIKEDKSK